MKPEECEHACPQEPPSRGLRTTSSEASAYAAVGYKADDGNASKLARKVRDRVQEITGKAAERAGLSVEYVIDTLMENVEICMGRKSIRIQKPSSDHNGIVEIDVTKHDPAGVVASCTLLGKHLRMFTERSEIKVETKVDITDPQQKLQLAREILFMIAKAEHAAKTAPKTIECSVREIGPLKQTSRWPHCNGPVARLNAPSCRPPFLRPLLPQLWPAHGGER